MVGEVAGVRVCPETLRGLPLELVSDAEGGMVCSRCGADTTIIAETGRLVSDDWTAGGPGRRKPRPDEITSHWEMTDGA